MAKISVLKEFMLVSPLIMLIAQVPASDRDAAKTGFMSSLRQTEAFCDAMNGLGGEWAAFLSPPPSVGMIPPHVLSIVRHQLQILNLIVGLVPIYVMDTLMSSKGSTKMLFHYMSVLKNSFSVYVDAKITAARKARFSLFMTGPVWRNVVGSIPELSASVHLTNAAFSLLQDVRASFDLTYFASNHIRRLLLSWLYYNAMGMNCQ